MALVMLALASVLVGGLAGVAIGRSGWWDKFWRNYEEGAFPWWARLIGYAVVIVFVVALFLVLLDTFAPPLEEDGYPWR